VLFRLYAKGTDKEDSNPDVGVIVGTVADFHSANPIAREVMESGIEV